MNGNYCIKVTNNSQESGTYVQYEKTAMRKCENSRKKEKYQNFDELITKPVSEKDEKDHVHSYNPLRLCSHCFKLYSSKYIN